MNDEPLLDVGYVTVAFPGRRGRVRAVEEVRFVLQPLESLGLVGESGSGKTALARVLAGLHRPDAGQVRLKGRDLWEWRRRDPRGLWRTVQLVFQDPLASLNPRKTVGETLAEPLRALAGLGHREQWPRAAELLERVGLEADCLHRYPQDLDGDDLQRVAIARALAPRPELLILDEPLACLTVSAQSQLLALLGDLKWELGLSLLLASRNPALVERLCDTVAVLRRGRIVEAGLVKTLFARPQHPYTRRLLASVPVPGRRVLVGQG